MATVASHKRLFTLYQRNGVDNHQYYQEFWAHVETTETYVCIGAIGIIPTFLTLKIKEQPAAGLIQDASNPTDAERLATIKFCWDEFLGTLMLSEANKERCGALKNDLSNQYGFGNDLYLKSPIQCFSVLSYCNDATHARSVRTTPPPAPTPVKQDGEVLVFSQGATRKSTPTLKDEQSSKSLSSSSTLKQQVTNVCCKSCGKLGTTQVFAPFQVPSYPNHAMLMVNDDSNTSDEETVIILTQMHDKFIDDNNSPMSRVSDDNNAMLLAWHEGWHAINSDLVLIDSQSTFDLFTNPDHVQNIRPAKQPTWVHCNKGMLVMAEEGDFGDTPVYFDSRGIANVLSLYCLGKKIRVTHDSGHCDGVFQVHTTKEIVELKPTSKGLHAPNLKENP